MPAVVRSNEEAGDQADEEAGPSAARDLAGAHRARAAVDLSFAGLGLLLGLLAIVAGALILVDR